MALAENIKAKRIQANMSQEELSGIAGVTKMAISLFENGDRKPELYTALRIAKALGTTVEELADVNQQEIKEENK